MVCGGPRGSQASNVVDAIMVSRRERLEDKAARLSRDLTQAKMRGDDLEVERLRELIEETGESLGRLKGEEQKNPLSGLF